MKDKIKTLLRLEEKSLSISDYPEYISSQFRNRVIIGYLSTAAIISGCVVLKNWSIVLAGLIMMLIYWVVIAVLYYVMTRDKLLVLDGTTEKIVNGITKNIRYIKANANDKTYLILYKNSYRNKYSPDCRIVIYTTASTIRSNSKGEVVIDHPTFITFFD